MEGYQIGVANREEEQCARSASPTWSWGQAGLQVGVMDGEPLPSFQEGVVVQPRGLFGVYMLTQIPQLVICEMRLQNSPPCVGSPPCRGHKESPQASPAPYKFCWLFLGFCTWGAEACSLLPGGQDYNRQSQVLFSPDWCSGLGSQTAYQTESLCAGSAAPFDTKLWHLLMQQHHRRQNKLKTKCVEKMLKCCGPAQNV